MPEKKPVIMTRSGLLMPYDCDQELLRLRDIAAGLAKKSRYAGHCRGYYSIAQHSVLMTRWLRKHLLALHSKNATPSDSFKADRTDWLEKQWREINRMLITALLHDAVEAFWSDMPKPYKDTIPEFEERENMWLEKVFSRYPGFWPIPELIHEIDKRIRIDEVRKLFPGKTPTLFGAKSGDAPLGITIRRWGWRRSQWEFLRECKKLGLDISK